MKHVVTLLIETCHPQIHLQHWNWNRIFSEHLVSNVEFVASSKIEEASLPSSFLESADTVSNFLAFLESLSSAKEPENRVNITENPDQGSVPKEFGSFPNNSRQEMPIKEDEWEALPPRENYLTEEAAQTDIVAYFRSKGINPDYMLAIRIPVKNGFTLTKASALAVVLLWTNGTVVEWADPTPF